MSQMVCCVLAVTLLFSLTACGNSGTRSSGTPSAQTKHDSSEEKNPDSGAVSGKVLIVYFAEAENSEVDVVSSPSVVTINGETVGRMRALADMIQKQTAGTGCCCD